MPEIDVPSIQMLLERWQRGEINAVTVHETAEAIWESGDWPTLAPHEQGAIALEVLSCLDMLNQQFIVRDDVPQILRFLSTPLGEEADAWREWRRYWDNINIDARRVSLRGEPPYDA